MQFQNKTILVAGGAGFIGTNLCKKLLLENNNVVCIDNLQTGSINNIRYLEKFSNFVFINHNIVDKIKLSYKFDEIYNLACPASPSKYQFKNAVNTIKTCIIGSINLLDIALENNAKILFTSTSEIYGEPLQHPQSENYRGNVNPNGIRACYDEGKRCAETLFCEYYRNYNLDTKIVRIFNTYGPFMQIDDGRVITNFINQALKNEDITIYGNGQQTRSFCYIDDMVTALIKVMQSNEHYPINLGNPEEFTILELANLVKLKTKSKSNIIYKDLPKDDPTRRKPDITKAKYILNWQPEVSLNEGIDNTICYFKKLI